MNKILLSFLLILLCTMVYGQNPVLDKYVQVALENNLALKQQKLSLRKSLQALKEARGMFLPSLSVNARYSRAGGGRTIDVPVGSLVNPIYQTLNQLLQQQRFPTDIPDQSVPFLREREQETKLRLIQPLFQPAIYYNYRLKQHLNNAQLAARNRFIEHLVADVKTAYFNYLKSRQIVRLFDRTESVLRENLRVSEKLFQNHKATREVIYRAQAELSTLEQRMAEAEKNRELAAAYFNFLLNRSLDAGIEIVEPVESPNQQRLQTAEAESLALQNRYELQQLQMAVKAAGSGVNAARTAYWPNASLAVDYGIQGEEYRFSEDADFWMASVVVQWNLFNGFQDKAKVQQRKLEQKTIQSRLRETENQIQLEVREAVHNLKVARKNIQAAEARLTSARKSFEIIEKKYREGMAPQIEFLDARNSLTEAEINSIIAAYDYHIRSAGLERATAMYKVERTAE